MKPVSPVMPGFSEPYEFLLAKDQKQYTPIPTVVAEGDDKRFYSRWEFTDEEREKIARGGSLLYSQLTFGNPFQPICFEVVTKEPIRKMDEDDCLCNGRGCVRCCGPS